MTRKGINTSHEKNSLYSKVPKFTPRHIEDGTIRGLTGKPQSVTPIPQPEIDIEQLEKDYISLQDLFDRVGAILDTRGETMRLCSSLPPIIQERYLRQKQKNESCWAFYKRMVGISQDYPQEDPDKLTTYAERLAGNGNDVLTDPFGGTNGICSSSTRNISDEDTPTLGIETDDENYDYAALVAGQLIAGGEICDPDSGPYSGEQRTKDFNENPGKTILLRMLFLAILRLITSAIFAIVFTPMKWLLRKINGLVEGKEPKKNPLTGLPISVPIPPTPPGIGTALSKAASSIGAALVNAGKTIGIAWLFNKARKFALDWVEKAIADGPKLNRDVERFDALVLAKHVQETAYYSEEDQWPEAAMLYVHYEALSRQYKSSLGIFDYYKKESLTQTDKIGSYIKNTATTAAKIPKDMAEVLLLQKDYQESALANMDNLLRGRFVDNLFCCLFKFLGAQELKFLKLAQAILKISLNRKALMFESLDSALANLWRTIEKMLLSSILSILYNLFDEVNAKLRKQLQLQVDSAAFKVGACLSWNIFVGNLLKFIGDLERTLLDLVVDLNNSIKLQTKYQVEYIDGLKESQYIRRLLKLIDVILKARRYGELCKNSKVPTDEELRLLFNQVRNEFDLDDAKPGEDVNPGTSGLDTKRAQFDDCLKKVPKNEVERVLGWINKLKADE
jgi:hypothetical protein